MGIAYREHKMFKPKDFLNTCMIITITSDCKVYGLRLPSAIVTGEKHIGYDCQLL